MWWCQKSEEHALLIIIIVDSSSNNNIELVQAYEARREGKIAVLRPPLQDRATMRRLQESDPIILLSDPCIG
jgi:hypothetical protein